MEKFDVLEMKSYKIKYLYEMKVPSFLKENDRVAIMCPASSMGREDVLFAVKRLEKYGLEVVVGDTVGAKYGDFAGSDEMRAMELQGFLDDETIRAIFFARGGYGSVRILDMVSFENFIERPKWLIGFSDVTAIHNHVNTNFDIATMHAVMPSGFEKTYAESIRSLKAMVFGKGVRYRFKSHKLNKTGKVNAPIVGGNLSVIYSMLGSVSQVNTNEKILFIEDVGEKLYHIDRMIMALKRAGMLSNLGGLLVGAFTAMKGDDFGKTAQEIIKEHCGVFDYPIAFDFPAGHQRENKSIILGKGTELEITPKYSILDFR